MPSNINTVDYWNQRFASGDWEERRGRLQTTAFAERQVHLLRLPGTFNGTLLDFGCGLGDAIPIYRKRFPGAKLLGIDHSDAAIRQCRVFHGQAAHFIVGGLERVPTVDLIVASNVFEHLTNDQAAASQLLHRCSELYVFVPYKERLTQGSEHVRSYDEKSFAAFEVLETQVFCCRGWSQYGYALWFDVYLKNLFRPFLGKPLARRQKQIMFRIKGNVQANHHSVLTSDTADRP